MANDGQKPKFTNSLTCYHTTEADTLQVIIFASWAIHKMNRILLTDRSCYSDTKLIYIRSPLYIFGTFDIIRCQYLFYGFTRLHRFIFHC